MTKINNTTAFHVDKEYSEGHIYIYICKRFLQAYVLCIAILMLLAAAKRRFHHFRV